MFTLPYLIFDYDVVGGWLISVNTVAGVDFTQCKLELWQFIIAQWIWKHEPFL